MEFTVFQIVMVAFPAVIGAFVMVMFTLAMAEDGDGGGFARFSLPFGLGVWVICTTWAFWPMIVS